jgi:putative phosphoesterase
MLLGILSDTHDQAARTAEAVKLLHQAGAETLIHCGDVTRADILSLCTGRPLYFVFGNNDFEEELRPAAQAMVGVNCLGHRGLVELVGKRIGVTHGHLRKEVHALFSEAPDYLLTGHSHIAADERHGKIRRINPGALYRARQFTVALLDLKTDQLRFLQVPGASTDW